jgi:hypothetical protein
MCLQSVEGTVTIAVDNVDYVTDRSPRPFLKTLCQPLIHRLIRAMKHLWVLSDFSQGA